MSTMPLISSASILRNRQKTSSCDLYELSIFLASWDFNAQGQFVSRPGLTRAGSSYSCSSRNVSTACQSRLLRSLSAQDIPFATMSPLSAANTSHTIRVRGVSPLPPCALRLRNTVKTIAALRHQRLSDRVHSMTVSSLKYLSRRAGPAIVEKALTICNSVYREPTVDMFEDISRNFDSKTFDSVIAVGGGSVIDMSKGLAVLGSFGGSVTDYDGFDKSPNKPDMKKFAIPTTSGTGSEVSDGVVVIDEQRNTKKVDLTIKIK